VLVSDLLPLVVARAVAAERPPATAVGDPALLLVVLVDERARVAGDIADRGGRHPVGVAQPAEAAPGEDPVDRRRRPPEQWAEAIGAVSPARPGGEDLGLCRRVQATRRAPRSGCSIGQPGRSFGAVAADPLVRGARLIPSCSATWAAGQPASTRAIRS